MMAAGEDGQQALIVEPFKVQVGVFRSVEALREWDEQAVGDDERATNAMASSWVEDGVRWFALVLPDGADAPLIAHECVHMADFIMRSKGVPTGARNTELRAHLVEQMMRDLADAG